MHCWRKFGWNLSNTYEDIVLTVFLDARTGTFTHKHDKNMHYASGHTTLDRGIKIHGSLEVFHRNQANKYTPWAIKNKKYMQVL